MYVRTSHVNVYVTKSFFPPSQDTVRWTDVGTALPLDTPLSHYKILAYDWIVNAHKESPSTRQCNKLRTNQSGLEKGDGHA